MGLGRVQTSRLFAERADMAPARKLPRIPKAELHYVLGEIAGKLERGESLAHGDAGGGVSYIERDIAVAVLRAVAEGRNPSKVLFGSGALPQPRNVILKRVATEVARLGGGRGAQRRAFDVIAKQDGRHASAVKADHARAVKADHEHWRYEFKACRWPKLPFWDMTDEQVDEWLSSEPISIVDEHGAAVEPATYFRARRDEEVKHVLQMTGWRSLPHRYGDK